MPFHQLHDLLLPIRLPVAEIDPNGNRQTELSSHDFGVILSQNPFLNQALDKPGEIPQHIGIILLGL